MPTFSKVFYQGYSFKESFNYYLRSQGKIFALILFFKLNKNLVKEQLLLRIKNIFLFTFNFNIDVIATLLLSSSLDN